MTKFIKIIDSEGRIKLINIDQIRKISGSLVELDNKKFERDEDFTDIETTNGIIHKAKINFGFILVAFEKNSINLIPPCELEKKQHLNITHPTNKRYSFEWDGGFTVNIVEMIPNEGQRIKGGITITTKTHDEAFTSIMEYIEENPWMEN